MKSVVFFSGQAGIGQWSDLVVADGPITRPLDPLNPGFPGSIPRGFVQLDGGRVLFQAIDDAVSPDLWVSDGTNRGTFRLRDIGPGVEGSEIGDLVVVAPGRAMFTTGDGTGAAQSLWITDGTVAGTRKVSDAAPSVAIDMRTEKLIPMGDGRVLFTSFVDGSGEELWISNGTARGTRMVADLDPGFGSGAPRSLQPLGDGRFVFSAFVDGAGEEIFVTNGRKVTPLGDLRPGMIGSDPKLLTPMGNGLMLFTADDGVTRREPWVTDGTPAGTLRLGNLNPFDSYTAPPISPDFNPGDAQIDGFTVLRDGLAVFVGHLLQEDEATGRQRTSLELYVTDGTSEGTRPLAPVAPVWPLEAGYDARFGIPRNLTVLPDGRLVYEAYDTALSRPGYWLSDGTPEGTRALGLSAADRPLHLVGRDKLVYVAGSTSVGAGIEPYVIDLSAETVTLLRDIAPGGMSSRPRDFTPLGDGRLVFSAASRSTEVGNRDVDVEPWVTDGTRAGTFKLADLNPAVVGPWSSSGDGSSNPSGWVSLGDGRAAFTIDPPPFSVGGASGPRPAYITDGTVAGTRPLLDSDGVHLRGAAQMPLFVAAFDAPTLSIAPRRADRLEGDAGTTPFSFTVTRDGARLDAVTVAWRVVGVRENPADATDFAGPGMPSGTLRFAPGVAERNIVVQVRGDVTIEPDETFAVRLSAPKGAEITRGQAIGTIRSDDLPIIGTPRADTLRGSNKPDLIEGRGGADRLFGQGGDDVLFGGGGDDILFGGAGRDRLFGDAGNDRLTGGGGDDVLFGGGGDDILFGGPGRDRLFGGAGDDRLIGGAGDDVLFGGGGRDVFAFGPGSGRDVVADFTRGVDRIDLGARSDVTAFRDLRGDIVQRGADTAIRPGGGNDVIVLRDIEADALRPGDFLFS